MNPETIILQRPLRNYYTKTSQKILEVMKDHCRQRGLGLPDEEVLYRRPRTIFFSAENVDQAAVADVIWQMVPMGGSTTIPCRVTPKTMEKAFRKLYFGMSN